MKNFVKPTKKEVGGLFLEFLVIMCGTFIMALGFRIFLTPHNIVPGGFMGIAQIIYDLLASINFSAIPVSIWYIILNIFLYIYAVKCLGFKFALRAGVGIFSYSIFVDLISSMNIISVINDQFDMEATALSGVGAYILYAIYGGVLMGIGMGLVFRANGSTGGCDMVAVVVNKFLPNITTGQIVMIVDGAVVILSAIVYQSLILPLYALITIYIGGKVSDMFVDGVKSLRAFYILTDKKEILAPEIMTKLNRGVTDINCQGMFTKQDKDMLLAVVRRVQVNQLKQIVKNIDPNAFMFSSVVREVYGNGFVALKDNKNTLKNRFNKKRDLKNLQDNTNKKLNKENITNNSNENLFINDISNNTNKNQSSNNL